MASNQQEVSQDEIFDLLSNPRRRFVINYLFEEDRPVSIQELSRELATWEFEVDADELTDQQEKRIYVALYQTHIPKLEDAGVVVYDDDTSEVEIAPDARQLQPYLDAEESDERQWGWYYLLAASAGLAAFLLVETTAIVGEGFARFAVIMAPFLVILLLAGYHYVSTR